jgi:hypothetical protein
MSDDNLTFRDFVKGFFAIGVAAIGIAGVVAATQDKDSAHKFLTLSGICFLISASLVIRWFYSQNKDSQTNLSIAPSVSSKPTTTIPPSPVAQRLDAPKPQEGHSPPIPTPPAEQKTEPTPEPPVAPKGRKHVPQDVKSGISSSQAEASMLDYTQDEFYDVIWHWHYRSAGDTTPRNLTPYCPECPYPIRPLEYSLHEIPDSQYILRLKCAYHLFVYEVPAYANPQNDFFAHIKDLIREKQKNGEWLDAINKERTTRGEKPLVLTAKPHETLDKIKTEILIAIAQEAGSCTIERLEDRLGYALHKKGKAPLDRVILEYHLQELLNQTYITVTFDHLEWMRYSLLQKGRAYLVENNLLSN